MPTYLWVSFVNHSDPSGDWVNPGNAYDGNWNTHACNCTYYAGWTNFLVLILPSTIFIDKIRFKYWKSCPGKEIDIDVFNSDLGGWQHVIQQALPYVQTTVITPVVKTDRIRVRLENTEVISDLYEVDVEQVIPDTPEPPPNPPEVYQTTTKTQEANRTNGELTRVRTLHHTTVIKPWVV